MISDQASTQTFSLQVGERLQLAIGETGREGWYWCRISDIQPDHLAISRPHFERGVTLLADGETAIAYCSRSDASYAFTARIKETDPRSDDIVHLVEMTPITRIRKRRFVRLELSVPLKYRTISRPVAAQIGLTPESLIDSRSINLSAGGLLMAAPRKAAVDNLVLLSVGPSRVRSLPEWMLAVCRHVGGVDAPQHVAGVEFILREDLPLHLSDPELGLVPDEAAQYDDRMQNQLFGELFAEQVRLRLKGMLR